MSVIYAIESDDGTQGIIADAFAAFALSTEGQTIIDEMFIPYAPPEK